jgi:hypothetical protein
MTENDDTETVGGELIAYDQAMFPQLLDQDPAAVRERFARRFMAAETMDDLFNALEGNTAQALAGRRVQIRGVAWAPFTSDRGIIPLAICDAASLPDGEVLEFATTGDALVLFLRKTELIGGFPVDVRIAAVKTRSGQTALNFERA